MLNDLTPYLTDLKRERSRIRFQDLAVEKAAKLISNDAGVTLLVRIVPGKYCGSLTVASGTSPHTPGSVRANIDDSFWQDEVQIRRLAAALIDFWQADQVTVSTLDLQPAGENGLYPWSFWLDWRRTRDTATLIPDAPVFGEPSIEREWHGGVERLWPEHEPWRHVGASGPV